MHHATARTTEHVFIVFYFHLMPLRCAEWCVSNVGHPEKTNGLPFSINHCQGFFGVNNLGRPTTARNTATSNACFFTPCRQHLYRQASANMLRTFASHCLQNHGEVRQNVLSWGFHSYKISYLFAFWPKIPAKSLVLAQNVQRVQKVQKVQKSSSII